MRTRTRQHSQEPEAAKPDNHGHLKTRPFSDETEPANASVPQMPNLQAQLEHAEHFGHNLSRFSIFPRSVQAKLIVGEPNDQYEQEADRVANQVMGMPTPGSQPSVQRQGATEEEQAVNLKPLAGAITPLIQRQDATEEEETDEAVNLKADTSMVQRQDAAEEEESEGAVNLKPLQCKRNSGVQAGNDLETQLGQSQGGGSPLSEEVRGFMEPRFGNDFSGVRVHTDSNAVQMNQELGAQAFTHGQDLYFNAGKYDPVSHSGKQLLAHELTHVVQQTGTIQRFESNEHKAMGDRGSADAQGHAQKIKLADDLEVTFGDITAMAGDFFGDVKTIQDLAKVKGDGKNQKGTSDEIRYVLDVKVHKTKEDKDYGEDVIKAVTNRYYTLAGNNKTHFTNPDLGDDQRTHEQKAEARDKDGKPVNNAGSYRENHKKAIDEACRAGKTGAPLDTAMLYEAFASHFLTDAYASGHMRTERKGISEWWNPKIPMFWLNLKWWMAENIAKHLNDNTTLVGMLTVQQLWEMSRDTLNKVVQSKGIPDLTFGDAISGAVHDLDNEEGVMATVGDEVVKLVGDGQILDSKDRDLVIGVDTAKKAVAGVQASLKDIHEAYAAGKAGEADSNNLMATLKTQDGLFRAEQLWPKALSDSDPRQTNKKLNWQVNTVDELLADARIRQALTHFAHEKADTLGAEISLDPPFKEEKTKAMQESVLAKLKSAEGTVIQVFRDIINYTPGSATGELGGIGGRLTDDNAVEYWKEAQDRKALPTLTLPQRKKLLKDVLDGLTIGEENQMVLDLLTTAPSKSDMKATIDHVGWRRIWQKLWGDDCRTFIRNCGQGYWESESFNSKKLEVKYLADGRTNDIAQETIIIILRTCTPDEVRTIDDQVGGWTGLAFDLTGEWDDEFKRMKNAK